MLYIKSESILSKKGKRNRNEDVVAYVSGQLYIVCDGVGGNGNGLLAAGIICDTFIKSFNKKSNFNVSEYLLQAENELSKYKKANPSTSAMASTVALTHINKSTITFAWIGDSSIYHFRNGKLQYKTRSHSWVGEAIEKGEISELEGYFHPFKNLLTRVVKDKESATEFETFICSNLQKNDFIMICSDGIQESWIDSDLEQLFTIDSDASEIMEKIEKHCEIFSDDNYSAIIYKIDINEK